MIERAIALLTVKISRLSVGSGGIPELTSEDVAFAKAGLLGGPLHLFDYMYLGEFPAERKLWASLMMEQLDRRIMCMDGFASGLCKASIAEYADTQLCPYCNGTGIRIDQHDCEKCEGSGKRKHANKDLAMMAGLDLNEFMKVRDRYIRLFNILNEWDNEALRHIERRLA